MNIERYTRTAIVLHWLLALLIIGNALLALSVDLLPDAWVRPVIDTHKSIGITALGLVLLRLLWRASHSPPRLPQAYASWERAASHVAHGILYALMLALPLSGWMHDSAWKDAVTHPMQLFGLFEWPRLGFITALPPAIKESMHTLFGTVHTGLGYALYALLALHVGAALKHQWIDRHPELQRMSI
jgi:cytochrome b561